ncbi:ABC transporter permease [Sedimentibacter sp.]|uniref:ABC transporter permease n=1 Tax=Sedimentibacter sp. TaxID=1960295 RepID=UPI0028B0CA80|nr:ABC transporter permease [Sedimentibacter sp.]
MMEIVTVLWREYLFFKRRVGRITSSAIMSPVLYLIAFGWGLGKDVVVEGATYMHFLIPGLIAMTTMNTGFNAVSTRIVTSKLYERSFEYYLTSPISMPLMSFGYILSGALKGIYASILIILVSLLFGVIIEISFYFLVICFLNSFVFSALGYAAALSIESHYDMGRFNTYIMTPMSFLCGTFFSLENLPGAVKSIVGILPLSHAATSLRSIVLEGSFSYSSILILTAYALLLYIIGVYMSYREMK